MSELLGLIDRLEKAPAYTSEELGSGLPIREVTAPIGSGSREAKVILVHEKHRHVLVAALRNMALTS